MLSWGASVTGGKLSYSLAIRCGNERCLGKVASQLYSGFTVNTWLKWPGRSSSYQWWWLRWSRDVQLGFPLQTLVVEKKQPKVHFTESLKKIPSKSSKKDIFWMVRSRHLQRNWMRKGNLRLTIYFQKYNIILFSSNEKSEQKGVESLLRIAAPGRCMLGVCNINCCELLDKLLESFLVVFVSELLHRLEGKVHFDSTLGRWHSGIDQETLQTQNQMKGSNCKQKLFKLTIK